MKKVGTILLSLALGVLLIIIGASVLLPSTKRGSFDMEEYQRMREEAEAATRAATQPRQPATTQAAETPDEDRSPAGG